jgi:hypothetical protein
MKIIYSILIILLVFTTPLISQVQKDLVSSDNLYGLALSACLKWLNKSWGHIQVYQDTTKVYIDSRNITIECEPEICDSIPTSFDDIHIEFMSINEIIEKAKHLHKEFPVIRIRPIINNHSNLSIYLSFHWVSYQNDTLKYAISEWCEIFFSFDCKQNKFVITETKTGGI